MKIKKNKKKMKIKMNWIRNINYPLICKKYTYFIVPKPIIVYNNLLSNKFSVLKENKNKSGIYKWINTVNNKTYIGSSTNLYARFKNYYSKNFLNRELITNNSCIYKALLLYGHDKFSLEIVEYCNKEFLIDREQYYIDILKPEYNILNKAGSSLGFKHSPETLLKFKHRKLSLQAQAVVVKDNYTSETIKFLSIRKASNFINIDRSYVSKCLRKNKFYKNNNFTVHFMK